MEFETKKYGNISVLLADDDDVIRESYGEFLKYYFNDVYLAADGMSAKAVFEEHQPQIAILDIYMPKMTGIELAREINKRSPKTVIIFLTAFSDKETLLNAVEITIYKYLIKPIGTAEFEETIFNAAQKLRKDTVIGGGKKLMLDNNYYWLYNEKRLMCQNETISLTKKELLLFDLLANNTNDYVNDDDIVSVVWMGDKKDDVSVSSIKRLVNSLRQKLPEGTIVNKYKSGYRIDK